MNAISGKGIIRAENGKKKREISSIISITFNDESYETQEQKGYNNMDDMNKNF